MKKIIQLASFLGLALIFSGATANAQAVTNVDAKIPFGFVVGEKTLPAGNYVLRIVNTPSGAQRLEIRDTEQDTLFTALMFKNGDRNKDRSELIFNRESGKAVLTKIVTGDAGYSVPQADSAKFVASDTSHKGKAVRN
jgi:hypothetical protein